MSISGVPTTTAAAAILRRAVMWDLLDTSSCGWLRVASATLAPPVRSNRLLNDGGPILMARLRKASGPVKAQAGGYHRERAAIT
ncbi:hypothetical protein GCM10012280_52560 [Wenjunlia tyrosinilytica]|uniref:Uncharacterized protein n=1 Tax=Wenjunlia tyrosinilytica TaxID=1544741 RepID=A0A917ZU67_9ACTN|nr:hypothetical protein GCM10012280_52560 [Wenjunlia tyrosinilytica]